MKEFEFRADDTHEYAVVVALTILNVLGVGLAAGMTLGYTSLDTMRLKIKAEMGTAAEKDSVGKVLSLLKNRHQFLCTLLVFNVICAECLPLLMDTIMPKWLSLLLSVSFVLLAGEVIPAGIHTYICIHILIHTYTQTYMYILIHTYIHTYICICIQNYAYAYAYYAYAY